MKPKSRQFESLEKRDLLTAYLVEDINTDLQTSRSWLSHYSNGPVKVDDVSYFALESEFGQNLWQTDDESGVRLVDSFEGSSTLRLAAAGDKLAYLTCKIGASRINQACTASIRDGAVDTVVKEFDSGFVMSVGSLGDDDFFFSFVRGDDSAASTHEIWESDGTVEGTRLVDSSPFGILRHADSLQFEGSLLVSNVNDDGRLKIRKYDDGVFTDLSIGDYDGAKAFPAMSGESLVITELGSQEFEILAGPAFDSSRTIRAQLPEAESVESTSLFMGAGLELDGDIFFQSGGNGTSSFWRSDGTEEGTVRLLFSEGREHFPRRIGDDLYVVERSILGTGTESKLWKFDTQTRGFEELLVSDKAGGAIVQSSAGGVFYQAISQDLNMLDSRVDLYSITGNEAKLLFADQDSGFEFIDEVDGGMLVASLGGQYSREILFVESETMSTRSLAVQGASTAGSNPGYKAVVNNTLLFSANNNEIHRFDGDSHSTIASLGQQSIRGIESLGARGIILADQAHEGEQAVQYRLHLWGTDGSSEDTAEIWSVDLDNRQLSQEPVVASGLLYQNLGDDILVSDGTTAGTRLLFQGTLKDSIANVTSLEISPSRNGVMFTFRKAGGFQVWYTDGTEDGTNRITGIDSAFGGNVRYPLASKYSRQYWNDSYFVVRGFETKLYRYDGGAEAQLLQTLDFRVKDYIRTPAGLFFTSESSLTSSTDQIVTLLHLDGKEPTQPAEVIAEFEGESRLEDWVAAGGRNMYFSQVMRDRDATVCFTASCGNTQLWRTDGTASGTRKILPEFETLQSIGRIGDTVFFAAHNRKGTDILATDGTEAGTTRYDFDGGLSNAQSSTAAVYDGQLYFTAEDRKHGHELWALSDPTPMRGDVDEDGKVTFDDFKILAANFGTGTLRSEGDVDGDGKITFQDFIQLSANFGLEKTTPTVPDSLSAIEPKSLDAVAAAWAIEEARDDDESSRFVLGELDF